MRGSRHGVSAWSYREKLLSTHDAIGAAANVPSQSRPTYTGNGKRNIAIGAAVSIGYLLPFLGSGFRIWGLHPRVWSYTATVLVLAIGLLGPRLTAVVRRRLVVTGLLVAGVLALAILLFPPSSQFWVVDPPTSVADYPGFKMTRLLAVGLPLLLLGIGASRHASSQDFRKGLVGGIVFVGILALVRLATAGSIATDIEAAAAAGEFSTIGLSQVLLLSIGATSGWALEKRSGPSFLVLIAYGIASLAGIFVLAQRAAFVFGLLILVVSAALLTKKVKRRTLAIALAGALLTSVGVAVSVDPLETLDAQPLFSQQVDRIGGLLNLDLDRSTQLRLEMWEFAVAESVGDLTGHGFGGFAFAYPIQRYPHNLFLEAVFELGALGALLVGLIVGMAINAIWKLVQRGDRWVELWVLSIVLMFFLKSGDLSTIGGLLLWLVVAVAAAGSPPSVRGAPFSAPAASRPVER